MSAISDLGHADQHLLNAAEGWLGLKDAQSATEELDAMSAAGQAHPKVLKLRWWLHTLDRKWEPAAEVAERLTRLLPDDPEGWLHYSFALHEMRRTEQAREYLLRVVDRFPAEGTMHYNLACYECRLGNLDEARRWLKRAFASGDGPMLKANALADSDLEALWPEICGS